MTDQSQLDVYRPPGEHVDLDPPRTATLVTPPTYVRRAVTCLGLSAALAAVMTIGAWLGVWHGPVRGDFVLNALIVLYLLFIRWNVNVGRAWAKWLFTIIFLLGLIPDALNLAVVPKLFLHRLGAMPAHLLAKWIVHIVLEGAALVLLFTPSARAWFRDMRIRA